MIGGEVPILSSNVLKGTRCWVQDLDVASHVLFTPDLAEVVEAESELAKFSTTQRGNWEERIGRAYCS